MRESPPCKECICKPICSNRTYSELIHKCKIFDEYLYDHPKSDKGYIGIRHDFKERLQEVRAELKTESWKVVEDEYHGIKINDLVTFKPEDQMLAQGLIITYNAEDYEGVSGKKQKTAIGTIFSKGQIITRVIP
ncbi:MAG: hypothetical protein ACTSW1_07760 [Candidatus Hodarchaeales archaeon]